jgi:pSer/pThr/pTyr-binding forkhead associated (FHA) protein
VPFLELNQRLHPLQAGENLLRSDPEADLCIPQFDPGQQVTIRVERVGALVWAVGAGQALLNGQPISSRPSALRHGDHLSLNGSQLVYLDHAVQHAVQPVAIAEESTIPMGVTIPMQVAPPKRAAAEMDSDLEVRAVAAGGSRSPGAAVPPQAPRAIEPASPVMDDAPAEVVAVLKKLEDGPSYVIDKCGFRIGREKRCDLVIPEKSVSRLHAEIAYLGGNYLLRDLGRGGTTVNGEKLEQPHKLRVGDTVEIGGHKFAFARRPATAEGLVRPGDVTPIYSAIEEAPTMIAVRRKSNRAFTWLLVLLAAGGAAWILLTSGALVR